MMRSLYSGVTGLKSQQTAMDVIGNNIANVNTVGFKASRVSFNELFYQTTQTASGPDAANGKGGQNAKQIGLGAATSAISVDITNPGGYETTNRPFDIAINGKSFFVVQKNGTNYFTKAGNFKTDEGGNLVTESGCYVMGYATEKPGAALQTDMVRPLEIYTAKNMYTDPRATSKTTITGNINRDDADLAQGSYITTNVSIFDNLGNEYDVQLRISKEYDSSGNVVNDSDGNPKYDIQAAGIYQNSKLISGLSVSLDTTSLSFDPITGKVIDKKGTTDGLALLNMKVTGTGTEGEAFTYTQEDVDDYLKANPTETTAPFAVGDVREIQVDCRNLTQFGTETNLDGAKGINGEGAGKKVGSMTSVGVQTDGKIVAAYDNGDNEVIGQIAVASFANAAGLEKIGDNMYAQTLNSGTFDGIGKTITAVNETFSPGVLEMSNVDLSQEFTNMIVTQRGFQANSRVITTSDSMLEELLSLKR